MTVSLARRLVWEGVIGPDDANLALHTHVTERISFLGALAERHPELSSRLETELGLGSDGPNTTIVPDPELLALLPPGLPVALAAVPLFRDALTHVVHVAAAYPADTHVAGEMAHHLGAPVEVTGASLRAVLAALPARAGRRQTPAFGTRAPATVSSRPPSGNVHAVPPSGTETAARPSERPIPLVRIAADASSPPSTARGVAFAPGAPVSPNVERPVRAAPIRPEPIIPLTRARPALASSPTSSARESLEPQPSPPERPPVDEGRAFEELAQAESPEDVVTALVAALATVAERVVVLALRGKTYEGRETNDAAAREAVRAIAIPADRPSILLTAVQAMAYVGPIPNTAVHGALSQVLGAPAGEIAAGAVMVSGRAALVYVIAGLETAYLATRRGNLLAEAAGKALARIVRERKK